MTFKRKSCFKKDKSSLKEYKAYKNAITKMVQNGQYARYVNYHAYMNKYKMHSMGFGGLVGTWRFLAWHRIYLRNFERELRHSSKDSSVYIPYWKWTDGGVPEWMKNFTPSVKDIIRRPDLKAMKKTIESGANRVHIDKAFIEQKKIDDILKKNNFKDFSLALEQGPHNNGHMKLGPRGRGMGDIRISPIDPMFWMHHANVDRIWAKWQSKEKNRIVVFDVKAVKATKKTKAIKAVKGNTAAADIARIENKYKNMRILRPWATETISTASQSTLKHGYEYEKP